MSLNKACQAREYNSLLEKSSKYFRIMPQMLDMILIQEWSGDIAQDIYRIIYAFKGRYCYKSNNDFVTITHSQIKERLPKKSIETIKRGLRNLERAGWLEIIQRGSKHLPNQLRLTMPEHLVARLNTEIYQNTILSPGLTVVDNSATQNQPCISPEPISAEIINFSSNQSTAILSLATNINNTNHSIDNIKEQIIPEQDLQLLEKHNALFAQYKHQGLNILACAQKVAAEFTSTEIEIISQTEAKLQQGTQKCRPERSNMPSELIKYAPPKSNNIKNKIIKLTNNNFVEEKISLSKNDALHITQEIHNMKLLGNIRGNSAAKNVAEIIEEVKFHVSRYGGNCFLKALNGAKKLLRHGKWETPIALKYTRLSEAKNREYNAQVAKQQYMLADDLLEDLTNILTAKAG